MRPRAQPLRYILLFSNSVRVLMGSPKKYLRIHLYSIYIYIHSHTQYIPDWERRRRVGGRPNFNNSSSLSLSLSLPLSLSHYLWVVSQFSPFRVFNALFYINCIPRVIQTVLNAWRRVHHLRNLPSSKRTLLLSRWRCSERNRIRYYATAKCVQHWL